MDTKIPMLEDRWSYIDILECIGIIFVIMYHTSTYNYDCLETNNALYVVRYLSRSLLSTCVPLFFFANGYLLFNRKFDLRKHIYKILKIVQSILIGLKRIIYFEKCMFFLSCILWLEVWRTVLSNGLLKCQR